MMVSKTLYSTMGFLLGFGVALAAIGPDPATARQKWFACVEGQLELLQAITGGSKIKTCSEMTGYSLTKEFLREEKDDEV